MTRNGLVILVLFALAAMPALAQTQDDRITTLEQKLDELLRQAESIRQELQQLKNPEAQPPVEDLTQVEVAQPSTQQAPPAQPQQPETKTAETQSALTDVQTVENQVSAGASKALNPDISVIGNVLGHAGDQLENRAPASLEEVEVAYEAFIDPYAKGKFFISVGDGSVDVEEAYAQFVTLPWGLTAKAGKTKASFGKANTWHTHVRPWVDQPLMISRFFGDEGAADTGISVSKTIDNPWGAFLEATGEVYSGDVDGVFARRSDNDLFYNTHLKFFHDLTENSNVEVGTSWARGTLPEEAGFGHNRMAGVDVTYRWKPLSRAIYNSFIARFEGLANRRADFNRTLYGYYASADYQFAQRWFTGARIDRADRFGDGRFTDRGVSATLTFWPSEFSQLRGQLRRTKLGDGPAFNEFLFQLQFAIGAHGAHTF